MFQKNVKAEIKKYIAAQPDGKRADMQALHELMLKILPAGKLWFHDGKDEDGKLVSNPNIGYGFQKMKYAGGKTKDFFQIGISANTGGVSIYILGLADKTYLAKTCENKIGKASVTSYCIKFKSLKEINQDVLETALRYGIQATLST